MSFLSRLFGVGQPPDRYRTEAEYKKNRALQAERSAARLEELGEGPHEARLEFVFRTKHRPRARELARALEARGLGGHLDESGEGTFSVLGNSAPMSLDRAHVLTWTDDMCRFGYEHDAEFEGWRLP